MNPVDQLVWWRPFYTSTQLNECNLHGSFQSIYDENEYRIFITIEEFTCFHCYRNGHKAEDCTTRTHLTMEGDDDVFFLETSEDPNSTVLNLSN